MLGEGAWGNVLLGRFRGCKLAVKQVHSLVLSPSSRSSLQREMRIASRCRHPYFLQFTGATNDEGTPLLVTELIETSLRALLDPEFQPLSDSGISIISSDVALALNYLHQTKPLPIIHRDLSSANVLLWRHGLQWQTDDETDHFHCYNFPAGNHDNCSRWYEIQWTRDNHFNTNCEGW